jgi:hypothetical protein
MALVNFNHIGRRSGHASTPVDAEDKLFKVGETPIERAKKRTKSPEFMRGYSKAEREQELRWLELSKSK